MLNKFFTLIGKKEFFFDESIKFKDLSFILFQRGIWFLWFFINRFRFRSASVISFISPFCSILFPSYLSLGKTVTIEPGVVLKCLTKRGVFIGNNVTIKRNTIIDGYGVLSSIGDKLSIHDNVGISEHCFLQVRGELTIHDSVIIGPYTKIFTENHIFSDSSILIKDQGVSSEGVIIGQGCWIGSNVVIIDGTKIGKNSVIAAGSVVRGEFPDHCLIAGIPAKFIKSLKE